MGGGEGKEATVWETKQTHLIQHCTIKGKQTLQCQLENKELAYTGKWNWMGNCQPRRIIHEKNHDLKCS